MLLKKESKPNKLVLGDLNLWERIVLEGLIASGIVKLVNKKQKKEKKK